MLNPVTENSLFLDVTSSAVYFGRCLLKFQTNVLSPSTALNLEVGRSSQTLVNFQQILWRLIPADNKSSSDILNI
jgi:hypothetical protein